VTDRPICEHCGQRVIVKPASLLRRHPQNFAAWCGCSQVSPSDYHYRDTAYGTGEAGAIEAWSRQKP